MSKKENKKMSIQKMGLIVILMIVLGFTAYKTGFIDFVTDINAMQEFFKGLGIVGYGVYILLFTVVAVFMLPASVITMVAGITFGPVLGGILALVGSTIGGTIAFIIAKYVARDKIIQKFEGNKIFSKIEKGVEENGSSFLILTRLVPIFPYNVQNYAYGVTSMKTGTFFMWSLLCMAPGAFIYAYMAGDIVTNGLSVGILIKFAGAGLILFLISLIPKYIAKKKGINLND